MFSLHLSGSSRHAGGLAKRDATSYRDICRRSEWVTRRTLPFVWSHRPIYNPLFAYQNGRQCPKAVPGHSPKHASSSWCNDTYIMVYIKGMLPCPWRQRFIMSPHSDGAFLCGTIDWYGRFFIEVKWLFAAQKWYVVAVPPWIHYTRQHIEPFFSFCMLFFRLCLLSWVLYMKRGHIKWTGDWLFMTP